LYKAFINKVRGLFIKPNETLLSIIYSYLGLNYQLIQERQTRMIKDGIRYVMFDFDGTLIDSMPFLENNAISLLTNHYSFSKTEAREKYRNTTGLPFVQQMELIAPSNPLNSSVVERFEQMKLDLIYEQHPFEDALTVLKSLKENRYLMGISSGTIESIITTYLVKRNFHLVDDIMGFRPGFEKGKDHFNYVKKRHSLSSAQILFVGDSLNDAKRANDNNISFIGRRGMFKEEDFDTIIPNCIVIKELSELVTSSGRF
jgi:phosphoglycolate phosphatase-like HAD superfamily hydrolase